MKVQNRHIRALRPYLVGERPKDNGEWDMYCPLHEDSKRSASLNVLSGEWYCFAGCGGGDIGSLLRRQAEWVPPSPGAARNNGHARSSRSEEAPEIVTEANIAGWHASLMSNESALDNLLTTRGLYTDTVVRFQIGYDRDRRVYTIPVRGPDGEIWNVRRYDLQASSDRRKIWSVKGMRVCELYPIQVLADTDSVTIGEGEWDILVTNQNGFPAVTRTAGASTWQHRWNELFKGKTLYLCQDADDEGQSANRKIARALHRIADVRIMRLPYEIVKKHGKDLTDFWMEHDRADFEQMMSEAQPWKRSKKDEAHVTTVMDSFNPDNVAKPVRLSVTIKGRKDPGYVVPRFAKLLCTRDAGAKCQVCPLNAAGGEATLEIEPHSPLVMSLMDATNNQVHELIRNEYGAVKCNRLTIETDGHQAVEVLFARPALDHFDGTKIMSKDYKGIKITSVGQFDTMPNNTVLVTGALYPNPRTQANEFLAWEMQRQETSIDKFELSDESLKLMRIFQTRGRQSPLRRIAEIERELASHVTRIIGRPEMHAVMDLTFHGVLSFKFGGQIVHRGWIESIVVGDTRTGKSEAAERLVRHFGAGEIVGGEAATLPGLVGGLQQMGGRDWAVTWGVIPLNDRRLVVIDELSGLHPDEIAKMSDVRASGVARLTKIQQEVTLARTRLLWLGNPRHGGMDQYTYGVDSLRSLIGNPEDIARFDLAMALAIGDVPSASINQPPAHKGGLTFTSEACNRLLMWVWTRQPEQIVWQSSAEDDVYAAANSMGRMYIEDPPIIQAANVRIKIARVATAMAARLFSTDKECEKIVVKPNHVAAAVQFMDHLYNMPSFGYADRSRERLGDMAEARENADNVKQYLLERRGLAKFLRNVPRFRRADLEEGMNLDREEANGVINKLWEARMIRKDGDWCVEPTLHTLLREVKW